jgi:hypothetical protein
MYLLLILLLHLLHLLHRWSLLRLRLQHLLRLVCILLCTSRRVRPRELLWLWLRLWLRLRLRLRCVLLHNTYPWI